MSNYEEVKGDRLKQEVSSDRSGVLQRLVYFKS